MGLWGNDERKRSDGIRPFANPRAAQAAYEDLRFGKASELAKQVYLTNFFNVKRNGQDMA